MKPSLRRGAFLLASTMVISATAPAATTAFAAQNFTYAFQNGGAVDRLTLEPGDSIDLRFIGVKDYKNYSLSWSSSNPAVAVVDKSGVVTAREKGTAIITLNVGDGSVYTSQGVAITVGELPAMEVVLGTSKTNTFHTYTLEEDASLDLNFYGVTDWSSGLYSTKWVSSNPTVATVDNKGVVTPVAPGEASVTIVITNRITGNIIPVVPVEITVPAAEEVSVGFTPKQTSDSVVTLTFGNKDITAADLERELSFYYYVGDIKISYPIKITSVKDGVATLTSYVTFTDGTRYGFTYGEESAEFVATIGDVASIEASWSCDGDEFKAYADTDTTISYKLLNKHGVDITETALSRSGAGVNFSLVKESEEGEYWISDSNEGKIFFNAEKAVAQVVVEYVTGEFHPETYEPIPGPKTYATIISSKSPAYGIDVAAGGTATIVKNSAAVGESIDWNKASNVIALGDDLKNTYRLVAKLTDTKGDTVYTDSMDASKGFFSFATTNNAILYVDSDGTLMTNNTGTVNVLIYFTPVDATTSTVVAVLPVTVRAARTVTSMILDKTSDVISTESGKGFNETTFTVTLKDQLGDPIEGEITVENNLKSLPNGVLSVPSISPVEGSEGEYTFTITGNAENLPTGANGYSYNFTIKADDKITKNVNVTVKKPTYDKEGNLVISGYKVEFTGDHDLKTEDDQAKTAVATLYLLSNGVKADIAELSEKKASISSMTAGSYYYTVTKGSTSISAEAASGGAILIPLTEISSKEINGSNLDVVDKTKNGAGTYTVTIYKGMGTAGSAASALSQVTRNTLTVKDSQSTMAYAGKKANTFSSSEGTVEDLVMNSFKFKHGDSVLDDATDYNGIRIVVNANQVTDNGVLKPNSVCFVKSVDFYVETAEGSNTYVQHTVIVNDYVEVK